MKRMLKALLVIIMFVPVMVFADVAGPSVKSYEAIVVNENGVDVYNDKETIHLEYGVKVKVSYELSKTDIYIEYKGEEYKAKMKDFRPAKEVIKPEDLLDSDELQQFSSKSERNFLIIGNDSQTLKNGPAEGYGTAGELAPGEYKYKYNSAYYIYVEANGVAGWLDTFDEGVAIPNDGEKLIVTETFDLSCGRTLPVNTIIDNYYIMGLGTYNVILNYPECSTKINTFKNKYVTSVIDEAKNRNNYYTALREIIIYTTPSKNSEEIGTIYGGDKFFVAANYVEYVEELSNKKEKDNKARYYVYYDNLKGWADIGELNVDYRYLDDEESESNKDEEKDKKIDTDQLVIYCVIAGIGIALGALAIIALTNKRKEKR